MPWDSNRFIKNVGDWLASNEANSDDETAKKIAEFYSHEAANVIPSAPQWPSNPISLNSDNIIEKGFSSSFKLARILTLGKPLPPVWLPAATAIVTYWTGVNFTPMPPPPGGLTGVSNNIIFPGLPSPLNFDIGKSFQMGDPYLTAKELNSAILKHLSTITGLWVGTAPGTPPPPLSLPWSGLI